MKREQPFQSAKPINLASHSFFSIHPKQSGHHHGSLILLTSSIASEMAERTRAKTLQIFARQNALGKASGSLNHGRVWNGLNQGVLNVTAGFVGVLPSLAQHAQLDKWRRWTSPAMLSAQLSIDYLSLSVHVMLLSTNRFSCIDTN